MVQNWYGVTSTELNFYTYKFFEATRRIARKHKLNKIFLTFRLLSSSSIITVPHILPTVNFHHPTLIFQLPNKQISQTRN